MKNKLADAFKDLEVDPAFAIGNDLIYLPDFNMSLTGLFKNKVYTIDECIYCDQFDDASLRYASTWAAKEAVYKAVKQLDDRPLPWNKIEIVREKIAGRPHVIYHRDPDRFEISLTMSHDGEYVWAAAFAVLKNKGES